MPFDNAAYQREWRRRNPHKLAEYKQREKEKERSPTKEQRERKRNYDLVRCFGISVQQYDELLKQQNGGCAICDRPNADSRGHRLHVDHDHKTGEIRGLLCASCNKDLIGRRTDPDLFHRAAVYLSSEHTGLFVPKDAPKRRRRRKKAK